ncbi:MAG: peptide ABC transporter substrate-binding protein, partial [Verrucomicrobia bacterium]|nr:peptide ABC transporter substrate-binding protein [Verrucomicrobiota bacterium]
MRKSLSAVLAAVLVGVLQPFAISSGVAAPVSRTLEEANRAKVLLTTVGSEPRTLDPQASQGVTEHHIILALMEGLVACDEHDQAKCVPGMAADWTHNEDYSSWTFHLGEDRRWSNGDPVTAQDFVFSYRRMLTPSFGAPYADMLFILKGGEDYYRGTTKNFDDVGAKALDEHHLRLDFIGPMPYLLSMLQHSAWFPVHPATILKFGRIDTRDTKWTRPENYVGTGPFRLKTWRENDVIEVERNPCYWDKKTLKLNGIKFFAIENEITQDRAFTAGQLHKTDTVPPDKIQYYRRKQPGLLRVDPYEGVYFYRINVDRPVLKDPRVRLALNYAVDREAICKNILRADQKPATGYTPPGMEGYPPLNRFSFDPDRARRLLAEAGYPGGRGFPKFTILFNTMEGHRIIAEAIQQMWREELNIDVGLENQEWKVYLDTQNNRKYDISRSAWIGDFMDPLTFLSMWTTGNGNNNTNWSNPRFDQLIDQSNHTGDPEARLRILREAEDLFLNDAPVVVLYWYTRNYLLRPSVRNWYPLAL